MFKFYKIKKLEDKNNELKMRIEELKNENRLLISRNYRLTNYCEQLQDIIMAQEIKIKMKEGEGNVWSNLFNGRHNS